MRPLGGMVMSQMWSLVTQRTGVLERDTCQSWLAALSLPCEDLRRRQPATYKRKSLTLLALQPVWGTLL